MFSEVSERAAGCEMTRDNDYYYRKQAKEAEKQAQLARNDLDREACSGSHGTGRAWRMTGREARVKTPSRRTKIAAPRLARDRRAAS
jgi:hypothetical protein